MVDLAAGNVQMKVEEASQKMAFITYQGLYIQVPGNAV